jgi:hypothetical protein
MRPDSVIYMKHSFNMDMLRSTERKTIPEQREERANPEGARTKDLDVVVVVTMVKKEEN